MSDRARGSGGAALVAALAALAFAAGFSAPSSAHAGQREQRPNFVHVMTDDQTVDSLAFMPRLDRALARHGTVFINNHATTPLCCPSRATFLTGQYTHNHGLLHNGEPYGFAGFDFSRTLYTAMHDAGYRTGWIGKVLNAPGDEAIEPQPGFDEWFVPVAESQHRMFDYRVSDNGKVIEVRDQHQNPLYRERALRFLGESKRRPFLLTLSYFTPHWTLCPDDQSYAEHRKCPPEPTRNDLGTFSRLRFPAGPDIDVDDVARGLIDTWWQRELESLQSVDRGVAALVRKLRRLGELDNTYFIFQSDNGLLHGQHDVFFRKNEPWDRSVRIPMVIRGPGFGSGRRGRTEVRNDLTANVDVPATILDAAGVEPPFPPDGHSLLGEHRRRELLIERLFGARFWQIKTRGNWVYWEGEGRLKRRHLHDLSADPYQLENLAWERKGKARRLRERLERIRDCAAPCP